MTIIVWLLAIAGGYLLGGIPFGLLIGRLVRGIDVRDHGSGSIGATNVLRTLGPAPSAVVLLADAGKAAAAVLLARSVGAPVWIQGLVGVAAVVGHCWSPYIGFRGGKGVAASLGSGLMIAPLAALFALLVTAAVVARTRYVSLGSLSGVAAGSLAIVALVAAGWLDPGGIALLPVAVVVFVRHRENIARLRAGVERRLGERAVPGAGLGAGPAG